LRIGHGGPVVTIAYRIRDWNGRFETAESRKVKRLNWVAVPNKQDGGGRRHLLKLPDGPALFGAWNALIQVASRCPERGLLMDDIGPLDAHELEVRTDIPAELFDRLFDVLTDPKNRILWLETANLPEHPDEPGCNPVATGFVREKPPIQDRTGQDRTDPTNTGVAGEQDEPDPSAYRHFAPEVLSHYPEDRQSKGGSTVEAIAKALAVASRDKGDADAGRLWLIDRVKAYADLCGRVPTDRRKFIPLAKNWFDGGPDQTVEQWASALGVAAPSSSQSKPKFSPKSARDVVDAVNALRVRSVGGFPVMAGDLRARDGDVIQAETGTVILSAEQVEGAVYA